MVGASFTSKETVEEEDAQGELEMVHWKIFVPNPKPVIEVVDESELVIVPLPEINVHAPVPIVAVFAAIIADGDEIHNVWLVPATETVGRSFTSMATVEVEFAQGGFEIVHAKTFVPIPNPKIEVVGDDGLLIEPLPEIKVHDPVPTAGELAAIIALPQLIQIV